MRAVQMFFSPEKISLLHVYGLIGSAIQYGEIYPEDTIHLYTTEMILDQLQQVCRRFKVFPWTTVDTSLVREVDSYWYDAGRFTVFKHQKEPFIFFDSDVLFFPESSFPEEFQKLQEQKLQVQHQGKGVFGAQYRVKASTEPNRYLSPNRIPEEWFMKFQEFKDVYTSFESLETANTGITICTPDIAYRVAEAVLGTMEIFSRKVKHLNMKFNEFASGTVPILVQEFLKAEYLSLPVHTAWHFCSSANIPKIEQYCISDSRSTGIKQTALSFIFQKIILHGCIGYEELLYVVEDFLHNIGVLKCNTKYL